MPDDVAISIRGLGKKYRIGGPPEKYHTFRDAIVNSVKAPFRIVAGWNGDSSVNEFWALSDITLDIRKGEIVGIIGRNGAGKSTLLKILSRITTPTSGEADIFGRVGSLLEVGTGFHPELTGRENIYLAGSILGMRKREIEEKFDTIVKFAEIEKFIDTPVKRYSSGMYVRLAFAVAAHMDTEILLVDEVLAVGDAAFQKKCMGKMDDVAKEGRTVLFVSHNMAAIQNLCTHCILLENGKNISRGTTQKVISRYLESLNDSEKISLSDPVRRKGDGTVRFTDVSFYDSDFKQVKTALSGKDLVISFRYLQHKEKPLTNISVWIGFFGRYRNLLFLCGNDMTGDAIGVIPPEGEIICTIPDLPLSKGLYGINFHISVNGVMADWVNEHIPLKVVEGDFFGTGKLPPETHGGFLVRHSWRTK